MSLAQTLAAHHEHGARSTRKRLEVLPGSELDGQPHPKSMALGALAGHLVLAPAWVSSSSQGATTPS